MKLKILFFQLFLLFSSVNIYATVPDESFSYNSYSKVLETYVDEKGMVNYHKLKTNRQELRTFLHSLETLKREAYETWGEEERIAFWINAYNALTLEVILNNYPIKASFLKSLSFPKNSIRQIPGAWDRITFRIMDKAVTLNFIEHQILRKEFQEPRIHIALVCAAKGCPPLRREPYKGEILSEQLDDQTRKFLADTKKFLIRKKQRLVYLSPIFKWYIKDFASLYKGKTGFNGHNSKERAVLYFISLYLEEDDRIFLERESYDIKYLKYDWTLNEKELQ